MVGRWSWLLACAALVGSAWGQSAEESKRDAKLAEAWLAKFDWITDFDAAKKASLDTSKPIFAYFTRSYAF